MDNLDIPNYAPPPPPKRPVRPKITLQIPDTIVPMTPRGPATAASGFRGQPKFFGVPPGSPVSHISDPHSNPYLMQLYHNKASEFMFKQFEGFKDFTMNTAKSGLSAGEKSAFWFYNRLKLLSRKWFTHLFLSVCLCLYSLVGATIFVALESPTEETYTRNLTETRGEIIVRMRDLFVNNQSLLHADGTVILSQIEATLQAYELNYTACMRNINNNNTVKRTWTFWNAMFYSGTIFTTIVLFCELELVGMSEKRDKAQVPLSLKIPTIRAESETQTVGQLVSKLPDKTSDDNMELTSEDRQATSIRKRRNLSKNRGSNTRQREKTPERSRTPIPHEDTPTSDDEDFKPQRTSREIEADSNYEEMRRLVFEQANVKDPVYDLDTDQLKEKRAVAALERRRRSISPFALPDKDEIVSHLERKGSFIDPSNKLLSTNYALSPKDEDHSRRSSLTIEPQRETKNMLSTTPPSTSSPKDSGFQYPLPSTPKTLDEIIYPDEKRMDITKKPRTPIKTENVFTFEEKEIKPIAKAATPKPETPVSPGELVTKVIQIERTPSKKMLADKKPTAEVRERVVRTPSRKLSADAKPTVIKQQTSKQIKNEPQSSVPPVKPARSKSATRFANKTSESEMSEDQHVAKIDASKRRAIPVPRRYTKNKMSPKTPQRSQSLHISDNTGMGDKTETGMSQTSREIIELMQKARARSLSIPKDDPRLLPEYKGYSKNLKTPKKTASTPKGRQVRGLSCPKTIQIVSEKEILSGLIKNQGDISKHSRQSSGYIDASQSEYTSSCYSSSPSENEIDFDLSERTAELTRKLNVLSQEVDKEMMSSLIFERDDNRILSHEPKSVLRKRSTVDTKSDVMKDREEITPLKEKSEKKSQRNSLDENSKKNIKLKWKILANWKQFKEEQAVHCNKIKILRNKCIVNMLILTIICGLGGILFKSLEGTFENAYKCGTRNVKRDFIENLWRGSHNLREEDWKSMARRKLYEFENQLHTAHEAGVTSYSGQRSWNFMNSFVYCLTLVTTVGYGHIAPKTTYGRIATIVYAIIGIPLFLILLADFGKLFTRIIKFFWAFIRRFYYTRSCRKVRRTGPMQGMMKGLNIVYDVVRRPSQIFSEEDVQDDKVPPVVRKLSDVPPPLPPKPGTPVSYTRDVDNETEPETPAPSVFEIDDEFNLPISVAVFILFLYIIMGAVVYSKWEKWNFFESFYFIFISITTIGLGDYVPDHPMFMMASILYLVFGFALTSMFINVVQVKLSDTFRHASAKLGATIGLKVAEEDGSLVPITPPPTEIVPVHKLKRESPQVTDTTESQNKDPDNDT